MTTKQIIKKIIFVALTLTACAGLVVLLVAAIGKRNHELCKDYVITINGAQKKLFINEKEIKKLLNSGLNGKIKGEPIAEFNLRKLEQLIEGNAWVRDANLYFDNREVLHEYWLVTDNLLQNRSPEGIKNWMTCFICRFNHKKLPYRR